MAMQDDRPRRRRPPNRGSDSWLAKHPNGPLARKASPGPTDVPGGYTGPGVPPAAPGRRPTVPGQTPPITPPAAPMTTPQVDPRQQRWIDNQISGMRESYRDPKWSESEYMSNRNFGPAQRQEIQALMESAASQGIGRKGLNTIMSRPFLDNVSMGGGSREASIMDYLGQNPETLRSVLRGTRQGEFPAQSDSNWGGGQTALFDAHPELHNIYTLGLGNQMPAAEWARDNAYTWGMQQEGTPWADQAAAYQERMTPFLYGPGEEGYDPTKFARIGGWGQLNDWRSAFGMDPYVLPTRQA